MEKGGHPSRDDTEFRRCSPGHVWHLVCRWSCLPGQLPVHNWRTGVTIESFSGEGSRDQRGLPQGCLRSGASCWLTPGQDSPRGRSRSGTPVSAYFNLPSLVKKHRKGREQAERFLFPCVLFRNDRTPQRRLVDPREHCCKHNPTKYRRPWRGQLEKGSRPWGLTNVSHLWNVQDSKYFPIASDN